jgi:hypothetical protein
MVVMWLCGCVVVCLCGWMGDWQRRCQLVRRSEWLQGSHMVEAPHPVTQRLDSPRLNSPRLASANANSASSTAQCWEHTHTYRQAVSKEWSGKVKPLSGA